MAAAKTIGQPRLIVGVLGARCRHGTKTTPDLLRALPRLLGSAKPIRAIAFVLAAAGAISLAQSSVASSKGMITAAESDYYAEGFNARGEHDPAQDGAWTGELITAISQLSERPPTENIVLSSFNRLLSFQPYWGFQQSTPHYANPLAAYSQRNEDIRYWASSFNSGELLARLASNQHRPPNVFVLRRAGNPAGSKLVLAIASDSFPQAAPVRFEQVEFDRRLFDSPRFAQREVGPFVVIVNR